VDERGALVIDQELVELKVSVRKFDGGADPVDAIDERVYARHGWCTFLPIWRTVPGLVFERYCFARAAEDASLHAKEPSPLECCLARPAEVMLAEIASPELHDLEVVSRRDPTDLLLRRSCAGKHRGKIAHVVLPASRSVEVQEPDAISTGRCTTP
jgi:hypothetical protein